MLSVEVEGIDSASVKPAASRPANANTRASGDDSLLQGFQTSRPRADVPISRKSDDTARGEGRVKGKTPGGRLFFGPGEVVDGDESPLLPVSLSSIVFEDWPN